MPAAVAVPLITAAVSGTASVVGAKMASNASKNSAKTMADASTAAATDTRQATADALAYIERMRTQGRESGPAASYLSSLMGIPGSRGVSAGSGSQMPTFAGSEKPQGPYMQLFGQSVPGVSSVPIGFNPTSSQASPQKMANGPARSGGTVLMRAPDGSQKAVPAAQVDHYTARGATVIQ